MNQPTCDRCSEYLNDGESNPCEDCGNTAEAYIEAARDEYQNDEIQIDDDAKFSRTDDGRWVAAWVLVNDEDVD